MKLLMVLLLSVAFMGLLVKPQAKISAQYIPGQTTIAVLPSVNTTTDKWKQLIIEEGEYARMHVYKMFTMRGFQSIDPSKVDNAISKLNIDMNDENQWSKDNFVSIGKESGADLVAFVLIKQVQAKNVGNFLISWKESDAQIEVWLLDVNDGKMLIDDKSARGKAKASTGETIKPRDLRAVKFAVEDAYKKWLSSYPLLSNHKKTNSNEIDGNSGVGK